MRRLGLLAALVLGCGKSPATTTAAPASSLDLALAEVDRVHGGHGPWAVAGYRMGQFALARLGLSRQSFDLEIEHHSPLTPEYACVADGASAATGASLGKLNLKLVEAKAEALVTYYRKRSTGERLALRPTASFAARFKSVPMPSLPEAGRAAMALPDADIFEKIE